KDARFSRSFTDPPPPISGTYSGVRVAMSACVNIRGLRPLLSVFTDALHARFFRMETNVIFLSDYRFALRRCANSNRGLCEFSSGGSVGGDLGDSTVAPFVHAYECNRHAPIDNFVSVGEAARRVLGRI